MSLIEQVTKQGDNRGIEVLERLAEQHGWFLERKSSDELVMESVGTWCTYALHFSWNAHYQTLHMTCALDMHLPRDKKAELNELICSINEKLWIGHFSTSGESAVPFYRHTLMMRGPIESKMADVEEIIEIALGECDRFYPAFQFVAFGNHPVKDALDAAMIECVGQA